MNTFIFIHLIFIQQIFERSTFLDPSAISMQDWTQILTPGVYLGVYEKLFDSLSDSRCKVGVGKMTSFGEP